MTQQSPTHSDNVYMQRNTWLDSWRRIPCREGRKAVPENSPVSHLSPSPIT
ncbi:hypothetical protein Bca4012_052932 [Brassica carinata]|uniref:BnaC02g41460D protein n=3 Tax=Brassica TaxID=3705 RepID=A0A078I342_BRANA|nr:BnaC02g41460D [Brassica napus]VDD27106.1 unnamed protein product [Brassica oleracea]